MRWGPDSSQATTGETEAGEGGTGPRQSHDHAWHGKVDWGLLQVNCVPQVPRFETLTLGPCWEAGLRDASHGGVTRGS